MASGNDGMQRQLPKGLDWKAFTPEDSPKTPTDVLAEYRDLGTPDLGPGDPAFDFERPVFDYSDGTEKATGRSFHLQAVAAERPVALIFGSYT